VLFYQFVSVEPVASIGAFFLYVSCRYRLRFVVSNNGSMVAVCLLVTN
jgi:hypothetical protein